MHNNEDWKHDAKKLAEELIELAPPEEKDLYIIYTILIKLYHQRKK